MFTTAETLQTRQAVQLHRALPRRSVPSPALCFSPLETQGAVQPSAGWRQRDSQFPPGKRRHRRVSDLVVNVRWALRGHLLDDVHRVPVVPADLLVVGAEDTVRSPQRDDDVAGLRAVAVAAALGRGQRAQGQRGRVLRRVLAVSPPVLQQEDHQRDDDDNEDDAS